MSKRSHLAERGLNSKWASDCAFSERICVFDRVDVLRVRSKYVSGDVVDSAQLAKAVAAFNSALSVRRRRSLWAGWAVWRRAPIVPRQ